MVRDEEFYEELSWLEQRVYATATEAGARCRIEEIRGCKEIVVDDEGDGLEEDKFLAGLEQKFETDLSEEFPNYRKQVPSASRW